jgi:predicted site-specific integrase-resolvase
MDKYVPRNEFLKTINIHYLTLYKMIERNEVEIIKVGNKNLYNLDKFLREQGIKQQKISTKKKICYCRVSSNKQKGDLTRQIEDMKKHYPNHIVITDIASGLNYKRKGLLEIIDMAIKNEIDELVIAYRDRLTRFGFEMIEYILEKYSKAKIRVLNTEEEKTPIVEISKDILSIMNVYVAKINGLRKYKSKIQEELNNTT